MKSSFKMAGFLFYGSVILFRALLDVSYIGVISPTFSYAGFSYSFSLVNYLMSWMLLLISLLLLTPKLSKVSDYFFFLAVMTVFAPITALYGCDSDRDVVVVLIVLVAISLIYWVTVSKLVSFRQLPTVRGGLTCVVIICSAFVSFLLAWYFFSGVSLNLNLSKVYEFRGDNADLAAGGLLSYTNNWTYKIFNISLIAIALMYKRYLLLVVVVIIQVYFFAASAHKSVLFAPFLVLGIWYYVRPAKSSITLSLAFSGLIFVTICSYFLFGDIIASTLFSRRVFFVPAHLTFVYFEFFNDNPYVFWSSSLLSPVLQYPYDLPVSQVIGRFLGNEEMGANNGYISSGFAHAGLFGVALYALIIGLILKFINDVTTNLMPLWFAVALTIVPLRSVLTSSDLLVVMLTHGFFISLIIIFLARSKKYT